MLIQAQNLCLHFGDCGGCKTQDVPYPKQLERKAERLRGLFAKVWTQAIPITGSPEIWHYRNKVEFKFDRKYYEKPPPADFERETVLGFRKPGCWYWTFDVEECRIFSPVVGDVLSAVRDWYRTQGLQSFHNRQQTGWLKHLVLRESKRTGDRLAILVTAPGEHDATSIVPVLQSAAKFTGICHGVQFGTPDAAYADQLHLLAGKHYLGEILQVPGAGPKRELWFRISPFGFFQVNPPATELLYGAIRTTVAELQPDFVYDFYGGAGGIALSISDLVPEVLSVESFAPATADGKVNAQLNRVTNIDFQTSTTEAWLGRAKFGGTFRSEATVILDPPRSGLHPKALRRLSELTPKTIIYVSCNPKLMARELPELMPQYRLESLQAFDLFPHTPHVEALAVLHRV